MVEGQAESGADEVEEESEQEKDEGKTVFRMEKSGELHLDRHLKAVAASAGPPGEGRERGEDLHHILDAQEEEKLELQMRQEAPWELNPDEEGGENRGVSIMARSWILAGVVVAILVAGITFVSPQLPHGDGSWLEGLG